MTDPSAKPTRRRRRRRRRLLTLSVILFVLLFLIAAGPWLLSTGLGNRLILGFANDYLKGRIEWRRLSLSWFGNIRIEEFRLYDPADRLTLSTRLIRYPKGLFNTATSPLAFGDVLIDSPDVSLYFDADGKPSILDVLPPPPTEKPKKRFRWWPFGGGDDDDDDDDDPDPVAKGSLSITDGSVRLIRVDGAVYEITDLSVRVDVDSLRHLTGSLALKATDGGAVKVAFDLTDLIIDEHIAPRQAKGVFSLEMPEDFNLGPALRYAELAQDIEGSIRAGLQGRLQGGTLSGEYQLAVIQLQELVDGLSVRPPIDADLAGSFNASQEQIDGRSVLTSRAGRLDTTFDFKPSEEPVLSAEGAIHLPDLTATANGTIDLAILAESAPSLVKLLPEVELTSGELRIEDVNIRGGREPQFKGQIALRDVAGRHEGRPVEVQPIAMFADVGVTEADGLIVRQLEFGAGFAQISAAGTMAAMGAGYRIDLAAARADLGQIFELSEDMPTGILVGRLALEREGETYRISANGSADDVRYPAPNGELVVPPMTYSGMGAVVLVAGQLATVTLDEAMLTMGELTLAPDGGYVADDGRITVYVNVDGKDLSELMAMAQAFSPEPLPTVTGVFGGSLSVKGTLDDQLEYVMDWVAKDVTIRDKGEGVTLTKPTFSANGHVVMADGKPTAVLLEKMALKLDELLQVDATATVDVQAMAFDVKTQGELNDLPGLQALAQEFGAPAKGQVDAESVGFDVTASRADEASPINSSGEAWANSLAVDGNLVAEGPGVFEWTEAQIDLDRGVYRIAALKLDSALAQMTAKDIEAAPKELRFGGSGDLTVDLGKCVALADAFVEDEDLPEVTGTLTWKGRTDQIDDDIVLTGQGRIEELTVVDEARTVDVGTVTFEHDLAMAAEAKRLDIRTVDFGGDLVSGRLRGVVDGEDESFNIELIVPQADVGALAAVAGALDANTELAGRATLTATAERAGPGEPTITDGQVRFTDMTVDGKPLLNKPADIVWAGVSIGPEARTILVKALSIDSDVFQFKADSISANLEDLYFAGRGDLAADLAGCMALAKPFAESDDWPDVSGRFTWNGRAEGQGKAVAVTGQARLTDLRVATEDDAFDLPLLTADHNMTIDSEADRLTLTQLAVASRVLSFNLGGSVDDLDGLQDLALTGDYDLSWQEVSDLLAQLKAEDEEPVVLTGRSAGPITITGPLNDPTVDPPFRRLQASAPVGWESIVASGVTLGPAQFTPALADGRVTIPQTLVTVLGGTARLAGVVDLRGDDPVYRLTGKNRMLNELRIDQELAEKFLSRFNPIFSGSMVVDGLMSLDLTDIAVPLSDAIKTSGSGYGRLDLTDMTVQPDGFLITLLTLAGSMDPQEDTRMVVRGGDFQIQQGGIVYRNFVVVFPNQDNFDLRFRGRVGFDDTLDLIVSVPVRMGLLEKLGIKGPLGEYTRLLAGTRVDIPIEGTRQEPKLDFGEVDMQPLIEKAMEEIFKDQARDWLNDVLKRLPK